MNEPKKSILFIFKNGGSTYLRLLKIVLKTPVSISLKFKGFSNKCSKSIVEGAHKKKLSKKYKSNIYKSDKNTLFKKLLLLDA